MLTTSCWSRAQTMSGVESAQSGCCTQSVKLMEQLPWQLSPVCWERSRCHHQVYIMLSCSQRGVCVSGTTRALAAVSLLPVNLQHVVTESVWETEEGSSSPLSKCWTVSHHPYVTFIYSQFFCLYSFTLGQINPMKICWNSWCLRLHRTYVYLDNYHWTAWFYYFTENDLFSNFPSSFSVLSLSGFIQLVRDNSILGKSESHWI